MKVLDKNVGNIGLERDTIFGMVSKEYRFKCFKGTVPSPLLITEFWITIFVER